MDIEGKVKVFCKINRLVVKRKVIDEGFEYISICKFVHRRLLFD
jgi:hypothetical protein